MKVLFPAPVTPMTAMYIFWRCAGSLIGILETKTILLLCASGVGPVELDCFDFEVNTLEELRAPGNKDLSSRASKDEGRRGVASPA
jgi:hypothetical protein